VVDGAQGLAGLRFAGTWSPAAEFSKNFCRRQSGAERAVVHTQVGRSARPWSALFKRILYAAAGSLAVVLLKVIRLAKPEAMATLGGRLLRRVGPWLPEHRTGRANLAAAFPEKSPGEIEDTLRGVWFNLGQVGAEYAFLDKLWDYDPHNPGRGRIEIPPETLERARIVRDDGKPALLFTAHFGNWELCAVAIAALGIDALILYRQPNIAAIDDAIRRIRAGKMGTLVPTTSDSVPAIIKALNRGLHVGMVVDQFFGQGVDITFFGRKCKANPTLARLARRFECPIYGARIVRLPGHRFRFEATPEIVPVRDADGKIDVQGTTQKINDVIEGWVREYPEQWLWLHRRWR